jgi:hypothetical protein
MNNIWRNRYPFFIEFPFSRRLEVTDFFVEHAADMVIIETDAPSDILVYGFVNEEDAIIFRLKFGS